MNSKLYLNIACYYFFKHTASLSELQTQLTEKCKKWGILGTILLASEGINVFLCGTEKSIREVQILLRGICNNPDLVFKESWSDAIPFKHLKVKIKKQIIAFSDTTIQPSAYRSPTISPSDLKQWFEEEKSFTLLDTRNQYEVELGTFKKAHHLKIRNFLSYEAEVSKLPQSIKENPVVVFCTGGIRCEKAAPLMEKLGFKNVFQLEGGILNYFEKVGGAHYQGDCFVFDDRVTITPNLEESETIFCACCGESVSREARKHPDFRFGKSCPKCSTGR